MEFSSELTQRLIACAVFLMVCCPKLGLGQPIEPNGEQPSSYQCPEGFEDIGNGHCVRWSSCGTIEGTINNAGNILPVEPASFFLIGGRDSARSDIYRFDATSAQLTQLSSMATARRRPQAVSFDNGTLMVFGGTDTEGNAIASSEVYDLATDTWLPGTFMVDPRAMAWVVPISEDRFFVIGGENQEGEIISDVELYEDGAFYEVDPLPNAPQQLRWTILSDGIVVVFDEFTPLFHRFDEETRTWTSLFPMGSDLVTSVCAVAQSDAGLVVATTDEYQEVTAELPSQSMPPSSWRRSYKESVVWIVDPDTQQWSLAPIWAIERYCPVLLADGSGGVVALGGAYSSDWDEHHTERLQADGTSWSLGEELAVDLPCPRAQVMVNGRYLIYATCIEDDDNEDYFPAIGLIYDGQTDGWEIFGPMLEGADFDQYVSGDWVLALGSRTLVGNVANERWWSTCPFTHLVANEYHDCQGSSVQLEALANGQIEVGSHIGCVSEICELGDPSLTRWEPHSNPEAIADAGPGEIGVTEWVVEWLETVTLEDPVTQDDE